MGTSNVLKRVGPKPGTRVTFVLVQEEDGDPDVMLVIDDDMWRSLGWPDAVTVTVAPYPEKI